MPSGLKADGTPVETEIQADEAMEIQTPQTASQPVLTATEPQAMIDGAVIAHVGLNPFPIEFFQDPQFNEATPLFAAAIGDCIRVAGHVGLWETDHIGFPGQGIKPPRGTDYRYFHRKPVPTTAGPVNTGPLCLASGHLQDEYAPLMSAQQHYDNPKFVTARGIVGEDRFGIWFSGAALPHVSHEDLALLSVSDISGDWRPVGMGQKELVGICAVAVPGFPVTRPLAASAMMADDPNRALVAAGAYRRHELWRIPFSEMRAELESLQKFARAARPIVAAAIRDRIQTQRAEGQT